MQDLKISLITVSFNAESTISYCIESILRQKYPNLEYIIIDGGSTDGTVRVIEKYKHHLSLFISEPDKGIYDAMNKGITLATGDVVGLLNADDFFADDTVLNAIADAFKKNDIDALYGDLNYINKAGRVIRKWRAGEFTSKSFNLGWMPPHPTLYCKRSLFEKLGLYSLNYGTAADYELMLRYLYINKLKSYYIKKVMINMKTGGKSNKNLNNRVKGLFFDLKAMRTNGILLPVLTLIIKPLRKIMQYF
ncbi:glycosyltransferase family 2 protein [Mucilaginibacter xinganensis]|uniref:Glycosyltransferase n=1 Tax=Mucilaginibacter xinganensis TaxID=1234841 RepID=A0A223P3X3_9SPHI|nr:glycosyltransferase family 2 protein [Mucilaginibacter xinganensis]ASU36813.1 glycosyltransferase [Mucilaginibacter xinganensis]